MIVSSCALFGSEPFPTLGWTQWSRIQFDADIVIAKLEKVEQQVLYKNKAVEESLAGLEKRLLFLLDTNGEELKEFVQNSGVVTTITLRVTKVHTGKLEVGEVKTVVVLDEVGDLCPHFRMLPIRGEHLKQEHVWSFSLEEGPLGTKNIETFWTSQELWQKIIETGEQSVPPKSDRAGG